MRILVVCDQYLPISEQFIFNQIHCLKEHDVFLFARKQINQSGKNFLFIKKYFWYQKSGLRLLYKLVKTKSPLPRLIQSRLYRFIKENSVDVVYIHYGTTAVQYEDIFLNNKLPVICAFHGFDASRKLENSDYSKRIIELCNLFKISTVPSRFLFDKLTKAGVKKEKLKVIPYGANLDEIENIEKKAIHKSNDLVIIHAGRLVSKKGVPDLVKIFLELAEKYKNIRLQILGEGQQMNIIKDLRETSNYQDRIDLLGAIKHDELISLLKAADIFVLNSRTSETGETEGLPNAIMEAMACGLPIISTFHSGIPEIIENNVSGLLVEPKNNAQLYSALHTLIENATLREQLAKTGISSVYSSFTLTQMNKEIIHIISNTLP